MRMLRPPKKQRGLALIVAIMIVALVTVLSVEIYWHFNLAFSRHSSRVLGAQGNAYLDALEDFARQILKTDAEENKVDNLAELWAQQQPPFETDHGYVGGNIRDAQGRLNINALQEHVKKTKDAGFTTEWHKRYTAPQRRFVRLLQTLEIEEGELMDQTTAENITDAVIDWLDSDSNPTGFGGAEGDHYSRLDPPLTIANRAMASVSELSLVKGVTPDVYQNLLPFIVALPSQVAININTMPPTLLRTLNNKNDPQPLSLDDTQLLIDARGIEGFESIADFIDFPDVQALYGLDSTPQKGQAADGTGFDILGLTVESNYFIFSGETLVGEHMQHSKSMLMRTNDDVITIRRTDANF